MCILVLISIGLMTAPPATASAGVGIEYSIKDIITIDNSSVLLEYYPQMDLALVWTNSTQHYYHIRITDKDDIGYAIHEEGLSRFILNLRDNGNKTIATWDLSNVPWGIMTSLDIVQRMQNSTSYRIIPKEQTYAKELPYP